MKMASTDYDALKTLFATYVTQVGKEQIHTYAVQLALDPAVKDLGMRFRWDLFWQVSGASSKLLRALWKDYTDDHIDTALKQIVVELGLLA